MTDQTDSKQLAQVPEIPGPQFHVPAALALFLDDRLFERAKQIAKYMSEAQGFMPPHLLGKAQSCFAVLERAITWKLSPFAVAQSTYETPSGRVGYEGKLCQAIIENSGHLEGGVTFEHIGDWSKVQGKFEIAKSQKGNDYAKATWTNEDAKGLAVVVRAQIKGERKPRELRFELLQAYPRNSTLWATDPKTQICYAAVRRFASVVTPGLFMGVPFEIEDQPPMRDMGTAEQVVEMPTSTDEPKPQITGPVSTAQEPATAEPQKGAEAQKSPAPQPQQDVAPPKKKPEPSINESQARIVKIKMHNASLTDMDLQARFGFGIADIPVSTLNAVLSWIDNPMGERE